MRTYDTLTWEPSERWVRAARGGQPVLDSRRAVLVREPGAYAPRYAFPKDDVLDGRLQPSERPPAGAHNGATEFFDLVLDGTAVPNAAWVYPDPGLAQYVAFEWFSEGAPVLDDWREEDEPSYLIPRDPHHRVDAIRSTRHVTVAIDGRLVADTEAPVLMFETGIPVRYYIPPGDIRVDLFEPTGTSTGCPYKGMASYWSYIGGDEIRPDIAWAYVDPLAGAEAVKGYRSFYDHLAEITVDGERVGG
jgi:uncharacterized protein (DUF427 family)